MQPADVASDAFYNDYFARLTAAGVTRYKLSTPEAQALAHEILLASLLQQKHIGNPLEWFSGALDRAMKRRSARG